MNKNGTFTIILILISVLIFSIVIIGVIFCTTSNGKIDGKFAFVSNEVNFCIYYDKKTKVMYAVSNGSYNSGNVTLLVDAEGKPLLYQGE